MELHSPTQMDVHRNLSFLARFLELQVTRWGWVGGRTMGVRGGAGSRPHGAAPRRAAPSPASAWGLAQWGGLLCLRKWPAPQCQPGGPVMSGAGVVRAQPAAWHTLSPPGQVIACHGQHDGARERSEAESRGPVSKSVLSTKFSSLVCRQGGWSSGAASQGKRDTPVTGTGPCAVRRLAVCPPQACGLVAVENADGQERRLGAQVQLVTTGLGHTGHQHCLLAASQDQRKWVLALVVSGWPSRSSLETPVALRAATASYPAWLPPGPSSARKPTMGFFPTRVGSTGSVLLPGGCSLPHVTSKVLHVCALTETRLYCSGRSNAVPLS